MVFETVLSNDESKHRFLLDPKNHPPVKQLLPKLVTAWYKWPHLKCSQPSVDYKNALVSLLYPEPSDPLVDCISPCKLEDKYFSFPSPLSFPQFWPVLAASVKLLCLLNFVLVSQLVFPTKEGGMRNYEGPSLSPFPTQKWSYFDIPCGLCWNTN